MRTVAVTNQKGGAGKTTTTVNLAAALAEAGERVLVVDLDAQSSATRWLTGSVGEGELVDVLTAGRPIKEVVLKTHVPGLDVVPGSPALGSLERAMASTIGAEHVLGEAMRSLNGEWDVCLVDCPPALGLASVSALVACQEVLVPVATRVMEVQGLADLVSSVDRVRARLNPDLRLGSVVAGQYDGRTKLAAQVVEGLRKRFGDLVFQTVIRQSVRLAEAPSVSQPITIYAPQSRAALQFRMLAAEFIERGEG